MARNHSRVTRPGLQAHAKQRRNDAPRQAPEHRRRCRARRVALGIDADSFDLKTRIDMLADAHAGLNAAMKSRAAEGRLFVVDHATLVDDIDKVFDDMDGRVIQSPFEVTTAQYGSARRE